MLDVTHLHDVFDAKVAQIDPALVYPMSVLVDGDPAGEPPGPKTPDGAVGVQREDGPDVLARVLSLA